jgi:hypothetical protein
VEKRNCSYSLRAVVLGPGKQQPPMIDLRVESQRVTPLVLSPKISYFMYQRSVPLPKYDRKDIVIKDNEMYYGKTVVGLRVVKNGKEHCTYFTKFGYRDTTEMISYEKFIQLIQQRNISSLRTSALNHQVIRNKAGTMPGINLDKNLVLTWNIEENTILAAVLFSQHIKLSRTGRTLVNLIDDEGSLHPLL